MQAPKQTAPLCPCRPCRLQYHSSVTLSKFVNKGIAAYMTKKAGGKRKGQQQGEDEEEEQPAAGSKTSLYLTINGQFQRKGFRWVTGGCWAGSWWLLGGQLVAAGRAAGGCWAGSWWLLGGQLVAPNHSLGKCLL
jgi:hypothetical protein